MKKKLLAIIIMLCLASTTTAYARGYGHGGHGGHRGHYSGHHSHHHGGYHNRDLGIAFGVVGGLILGTALLNSAPPPPRQVVYSTYQPQVIVQQPKICVEDQTSTGEWQTKYNGQQFWVPYAYPVTKRVQVPCY